MYAIPARRKTVTENDFLDAVNKIKSSTLERTNAAAPHHPDASGRDAGARLGAGGYGFSVTNSTLSPKGQMKSSRTSHFSLSRLLQAPLNRAAATAPFPALDANRSSNQQQHVSFLCFYSKERLQIRTEPGVAS